MLKYSVNNQTFYRSKIESHKWLGIRDGNITFEDSLDFDISEIESVYEDAEENQ